MKKIALMIIGIYVFAFNQSKNYSCETLGFSIQQNGNIINIPNDIKTNKRMQKDLGNLYKINFIPMKKSIKLKVGNKYDVLPYVDTIKNNLKVYVTKDKQVIVFVDNNSSQIAIKIPFRRMVIYYKCK